MIDKCVDSSCIVGCVGRSGDAVLERSQDAKLGEGGK